jgi:hypothetical protein
VSLDISPSARRRASAARATAMLTASEPEPPSAVLSAAEPLIGRAAPLWCSSLCSSIHSRASSEPAGSAPASPRRDDARLPPVMRSLSRLDTSRAVRPRAANDRPGTSSERATAENQGGRSSRPRSRKQPRNPAGAGARRGRTRASSAYASVVRRWRAVRGARARGRFRHSMRRRARGPRGPPPRARTSFKILPAVRTRRWRVGITCT